MMVVENGQNHKSKSARQELELLEITLEAIQIFLPLFQYMILHLIYYRIMEPLHTIFSEV